MSPISLLPAALSEMVADISSTGKITLADRYGLMAAILSDSLSAEDIRLIDRILYALRRGRIQMVDE
jgi:hypothetical protein